MRFLLITMVSAAVGTLTALAGFPVDTWQFWAFMIPVSIALVSIK